MDAEVGGNIWAWEAEGMALTQLDALWFRYLVSSVTVYLLHDPKMLLHGVWVQRLQIHPFLKNTISYFYLYTNGKDVFFFYSFY